MNVTFKPLGKREREWLLAQGVRGVPSPSEDRFFSRGTVLTLDGLIVLALNRHGHVIYQDGSDAIPEFVRAHRRVVAGLHKLDHDDFERIRRKGRPAPTLADILG